VKPPIPYLHGLTLGDVTIFYDSKVKKYRVHIETTHPAMEKVFIYAFQSYSLDGVIRKYPTKGGAVPYRWTLYTWINPQLGKILSNKDLGIVDIYAQKLENIAAFISGLMDSDGSIIISIKRRKRLNYKPIVEYEIGLFNSNKELLIKIMKAMKMFNISLNIRKNCDLTKKTIRRGKRIVWELYTSRTSEIKKLLPLLLSHMKNSERIERALLLKSITEGKVPKDPTLIAELREKINSKISRKVHEYIKWARECYKNKIKYLIYSDGTIVEQKVKIKDLSGRLLG